MEKDEIFCQNLQRSLKRPFNASQKIFSVSFEIEMQQLWPLRAEMKLENPQFDKMMEDDILFAQQQMSSGKNYDENFLSSIPAWRKLLRHCV